jgi:flagellar biosynthesis protein FlhA
VLQSLLRERVPIRDLEVILETLGDWAGRTKDTEILTEYARNALARTICAQYGDNEGVIHCVTLDPAAEDYLQANIQRLDQGTSLTVPPDRQSQFARQTQLQVEQASASAGGATVTVLCSPQVRCWVRRLIEPVLPQTPVLGLNEVIRGIEVQAHGVVSFDAESANVASLVNA